MTTIVSIDWGGTSCRAMRLSSDGTTFFCSLPAANLRTISNEALAFLSAELRRALCCPADIPVIWLAGAAGASDGLAVERAKKALLTGCAPGSTCEIYPDYLCNHAAFFAGGDGILSVNGTGSLLYCRCGDEEKRFGGWGYLLDETPSGARFGLLVLRAVLANLEGEKKFETITRIFTEKHFLPQTAKILAELYQSVNQQNYLGRFSNVLTAAYDTNDAAAKKLVSGSIELLIKQLKQMLASGNRKNLKLAGCGGLWENWPGFNGIVSAAINAAGLRLEKTTRSCSLVTGAFQHHVRLHPDFRQYLYLLKQGEKVNERAE